MKINPQAYNKSVCLQELKKLQNTLPVVFDLIVALGGYESCITPILREMIVRAECPFSEQATLITCSTAVEAEEDELKTLCFFPMLPILRRRRNHESDSCKNTFICTKKHTGHQSLTPHFSVITV